MLKFLIEFLPLLAFLIGYKTAGILQATIYTLIASVISTILGYLIEKKISKANIISTVLLLISGSLTIFSGNPVFIKMKPTILYLIFGAAFIITTFKGKPVAYYLFSQAISLQSEQHWRVLNIRFAIFFICMAGLNEIVWRYFSEESWVTFKVFGALPITILFILSQMPFLLRNKIAE